MKSVTISKILGLTMLSATMGLTACQNMPMGSQYHSMMTQQNLTDGQVIKVVSTANNGEIIQANVALPKLQSPQVRNYAQMMINEHSMNEQKGQALAKRLGVVPQVSMTSNDLQKDSNTIVNQLNQSMAPADRAYMMSQVAVHRKVLASIDQQLLPSASNAELKAMLQQTRNAVAVHLQMAEQLLSTVR